MPRNLDETMFSAILDGTAAPILLVMLTFRTSTQYAWSGVGDLPWAGNVYEGQGGLGRVGDIVESTEVKADGTSVMLSGVDPVYLAECMTDIQHGAPAKRWLGAIAVDTGAMVGAPYLQWSGYVDKATVAVSTGPAGAMITVNLENRMLMHAAATVRRYTSADQRARYPHDSGCDYVEILNNTDLRWGS